MLFQLGLPAFIAWLTDARRNVITLKVTRRKPGPDHVSARLSPSGLIRTSVHNGVGPTRSHLRALQALPAALGAGHLGGWTRQGGYRATEESLFTQATSLLSQLPTTPKVRAALYRVLANLSSVKNIGTIKDPLGRIGTGIELSGCGERQIIIDETSGRLLAVQEHSPGCIGELTSWTAVTASGWTDAGPALPKTIVPNGR
ncbi:hypothetical protein [Nonomuraea sp. KM90]|uniref:hypothetical protein n=1 Tax=Nonomuraea sp. KM90 TaxID=3457428 RepID=UPI003FCC9E39